LAVDCPWYAEAIDKHAEAKRPEGLLKRHFDGPLLCQCVEYTFCLCLVLEAKSYREALGFLIAIRRSVSPHQYLIAHPQCDMKDFLAPFGRYRVLGWPVFVRHDEFNFPAQALLIKLERCFALTVEAKIGIQLHRGSISPSRLK